MYYWSKMKMFDFDKSKSYYILGRRFLLDSRCRLDLFDRKWILNFIARNAFAQDMEAPPGGVDDMTILSYLHEPGVLQNLAI